MEQQIVKNIPIKAPASAIWDALTNPQKLKRWMGDPEMDIEVITDWKPGGPIVINGFHHMNFENEGTVLRFEPNQVLEYNYLSSLSRLPDKPENYSVIEFKLMPMEEQTLLTLTIRNFPTEAIFKHLGFYWITTIEIMKKLIEEDLEKRS